MTAPLGERDEVMGKRGMWRELGIKAHIAKPRVFDFLATAGCYAARELGGLGMLRFALLLLAGMFCFESAQAGWLEDLHRKALADRRVKIQEGKIPSVKLSKQQIAKLPDATSERSRIAWLRAGRQKDGTIFVCYLTSLTNYTGRDKLRLYTGTFGKDGSYQQSAVATFSDARIVLLHCHLHGMVPPVRVGGRLI